MRELTQVEKGIPTAEKAIPQSKALSSREITVTFNLRKLMAPGLIGAVIILAALAYWLFIPRKQAPSTIAAKHSIAVLPFVDYSPTKEYDYLCEGIPDTLINALSSVKELLRSGQ